MALNTHSCQLFIICFVILACCFLKIYLIIIIMCHVESVGNHVSLTHTIYFMLKKNTYQHKHLLDHLEGCNNQRIHHGRSEMAGKCQRWNLPCIHPCMFSKYDGQSHQWHGLHTSPRKKNTKYLWLVQLKDYTKRKNRKDHKQLYTCFLGFKIKKSKVMLHDS